MQGIRVFQETQGLLDEIKQHDKLTIKVSSDADGFLPAAVLTKLLQPHRTAYYFFVFVDKGSTTHRVDLQDLTVSGGQLLFVLPGQIHRPPAKTEKLAYFKLSFDQHCLALLPRQFAFLVNPFNTQTVTFDKDSKQRIRTLFETLHQLLHADTRQNDAEIILIYLNALLTEFNNAYFKNRRKDSASHARLSTYIAFKMIVESHLTEQHSINAIAGKLAISANSLYSIVKTFSGVSPKTFIINRLILEAQRRLYYSKPSIKELAYDLGFSDPDYFSRLFRKNTGKSISQYLTGLQDLSGSKDDLSSPT